MAGCVEIEAGGKAGKMGASRPPMLGIGGDVVVAIVVVMLEVKIGSLGFLANTPRGGYVEYYMGGKGRWPSHRDGGSSSSSSADGQVYGKVR